MNNKWKAENSNYFSTSELPFFRNSALSPVAFPIKNPALNNPQSWNLYSYVNGNPVNFNDPSGHMPLGNTGQTLIDYDPGSGETSVISDEQPQWWQVVGEMVTQYGFEATTNYVLTHDIELTEKTSGLSDEDKSVLTLTAAQDEALKQAIPGSDGEFEAKKGKTFCNKATFSIVKAMKADETPFKYPDSGNVAVANDAFRYLSNEKTRGKWKPVPESDVQALADKGKLVVGVSRNPSGHGHLVTARPTIAASKRYANWLGVGFGNPKTKNAKGPWIANIGAGAPWIGRAKENMFSWYVATN